MASLEGSHATNYSLVFVSYHLKCPDMFSPSHGFSVDYMADAAAQVRDGRGFFNAANICKYPAVMEEQTLMQARTSKESASISPAPFDG